MHKIRLGLGWFLCVQIFLACPALALKVAVIISRPLAGYQEAFQGFQKATATTWEVKAYDIKGDPKLGDQALQEVITEKMDMIVTIGSEALDAAAAQTTDIPLIYCMVLESKTIADRRTGGVLMAIPLAVQVDRIRKLLPAAKVLGILYDPQYSLDTVEKIRPLAAQKDLSLEPIAISQISELTFVLMESVKRKIDVFWTMPDQTMVQPAVTSQLISFSLKQRLPFISVSIPMVNKGALATIFIDFEDIGRQTADLAARMLKEDLSNVVEFPRKAVTFVNQRTAEHLAIFDLPALQAQSDVRLVK